MFTYLVVLLRIVSNSLANLFQKKAVYNNSGIIVNLYSYFLMSLICIFPAIFVDWTKYSLEFWLHVLLAGLLCTVGTIALIEALKIGELSELAPINSYKAIVGLISAFIFLHEVPTSKELLCVFLIVLGSYFVLDNEQLRFSYKTFLRKDVLLRLFALICTGIEASILKKIIVMSSFNIALILWAFSGFLCSLIIFMLLNPKNIFDNRIDVKQLWLIAIFLLIMQLSTNYVFSKLNVGISLALFQLSSLVSIYFGYKIFNESNIFKKIIGTLIMLLGTTIMIMG